MSRKKKDVKHELNTELELVRTLKDNSEKQEEFRRSIANIEKLTTELNDIAAEEAAERALAEKDFNDETKKAARNFSLGKFLREIGAEKPNLTGLELEMSQLAETEARSCGITLGGVGIPSCVLEVRRDFSGMTAASQEHGGMTIATQMQYQEGLRKKLVLSQMGATYLSGLVGNIDMIEGSSVSAFWEGENTTSQSQKKEFSKRTLSPKRLAVNVPISKQLLVQSSWDVEAMLYDTIMAAHAQAVETAAINGSGTGQPCGILNTTGIGSVVMGENGGAPSWAKMVEMETNISVNNADLGRMAYLTNSKVRGALKTILKASNVAGYIWDRNEVNGYSAFASNIVPSNLVKGTGVNLSAAIFGIFSDLLICQWGGLDFLVDRITWKNEGAVEYSLNAYHDIFIRRKESFSAIKDLIS